MIAIARGFGHRLMMDRVLPGGVVSDLAEEDIAALFAELRNQHRAIAEGLRAVLKRNL